MIRDLLQTKIREALGPEAEIRLDVPANEQFGDFSTNVALALAKEDGRSPREVAQELAEKIELGAEIERVEVAGPGFVNFYLKPGYVASLLPQVTQEGFGRGQVEQPERVNVEFISANPTGPLTLGNARGGFTGDVLARTLGFLDHKPTKEYYFNDAGTQIKKLVGSVKIAGGLAEGEAEYRGDYVDRLAEEFRGSLETENEDQIAERLTQAIFERHVRPAVLRMGIEFNEWFNEKELITSGATEQAFDRLRRLGLVEEREGATWLVSTKLGDERDRVLCKSNGDITYLGNDVAYHLNILEERGYDRAIKVWGADHAGQIPSLALTMEKLLPEKRLDFVVVQWVRLIKDGREFTMSKRAGTYVTVDDLLDEIGGERPEDVARWFFISRSHDTHMDFDLDLARERSEKNPVYYVQYAFARICGILEKAPESGEADFSVLVEKEETDLIKRLLEFPEVVREAGAGPDYPIHKLAFYAQSLATDFHKFYHEHRVLEAEGPVRSARLELVRATRETLRKLLVDLIGVAAPDRM
jgi:arginyl-tRNA synthetase